MFLINLIYVYVISIVKLCKNVLIFLENKKILIFLYIFIWYMRIKYVYGFFLFDWKMYMVFYSYLLKIVIRFYLLKKLFIVKFFILKYGFCILVMLCLEVC